MKCSICANYLDGMDACKYCHFEYDPEYTRDDWDILDINHDEIWDSHLEIRNRLWANGIECLFADIWIDDMAFLLGCNANTDTLASVLGMHSEAVYNDYEHSLVILNLFEEKVIREREKLS